MCVSFCKDKVYTHEGGTYSQKLSKRLPELESNDRPVGMQVVNLIKLRVVWLQFIRIFHPVILVHMLVDRGGCMSVVSEPALFVQVSVLIRGILLGHGSKPSNRLGDGAASSTKILRIGLANLLRHRWSLMR